MATARWPRWITSTQCGWQHWLAPGGGGRGDALLQPWTGHLRGSLADSRCAFILSITGLLLQRPLTTQRLPHRAAFPGRPDWRRSCSPLPLPTTVALATPSPERAAGPLPYAGHRRRTHSKSPADGPDTRRAPRGAGELGRRTRAARATVRFLCASSPRLGRCALDRGPSCRQTVPVPRSDGARAGPRDAAGGHRPDQLADVGGKALNLAELMRGGFRVPPGFCVTTRAYQPRRRTRTPTCDATARRPGRHPRRRRIRAVPARRGHPPTRPGSPVPDDVADSRHRGVPADGTGRPGGGAVVGHRGGPAVRQLRGPAGHLSSAWSATTRVLEAVRRCWASLWTDRAVVLPRRVRASTRARSGSPSWCSSWWTPRSPACCSPPTRSPADGASAVIDASPGLGEAVVSGAVNPDHFVVDTATGTVLERRLGDKRVAIRPRPGGGTTRTEVPRRRTAAA